LVYVEDLPLSAIFYSKGQARFERTFNGINENQGKSVDTAHMTVVMPSFTYDKIPKNQLANWQLTEQYAGYVMLQK